MPTVPHERDDRPPDTTRVPFDMTVRPHDVVCFLLHETAFPFDRMSDLVQLTRDLVDVTRVAFDPIELARDSISLLVDVTPVALDATVRAPLARAHPFHPIVQDSAVRT